MIYTETCHGEVFADAIASVSKSDQVIGVGVNCTPPEYIEVLNTGVGSFLPMCCYQCTYCIRPVGRFLSGGGAFQSKVERWTQFR